jgi:type IV pilus assembly protein PilE
MSTGKRQYGFTLIELMITVTIIGILASIAYPSYMKYVRNANRADAQALMLENAQYMERRFTTCGSYAAVVGATAPCDEAADLPKDQSPENGTARYSITLDPAPDATTFTIQAQPAGSYADTLCGTMTITQTGEKTESGTGSLGDCWKS